MSHLWLTAGWLLLGAAAGAGVRRASVRLARAAGLAPDRRRWQRLGPAGLAGALFGLLAWQLGPVWLLPLKSLWTAVLVQVIFFDLEHRLVLDRVLVPAGVAALALGPLTPGVGWPGGLLAGAGAGLALAALAAAGGLLFRSEALGAGDVKLGVFCGLVLGTPMVAAAMLLAVGAGGLVALCLLALRVRRLGDSIAYAPFLAAGTLGAFLAG